MGKNTGKKRSAASKASSKRSKKLAMRKGNKVQRLKKQLAGAKTTYVNAKILNMPATKTLFFAKIKVLLERRKLLKAGKKRLPRIKKKGEKFGPVVAL